MHEIAHRIQRVKDSIRDAAIRSGRKPEDIQLIAVTKTIEPEKINQAIQCGIQDIGENRVQEVCDKYEKIEKEVSWHLIGQLQTNKVKYIINKVGLIHSLDRISLAEEIEKRCRALDLIQPVLIQINIAQEATKSGITEGEVVDFIREVSRYPHISIQGLMAIAPLLSNAEEARPWFKKMKECFESIKALEIDGVSMKYLSMGMSNDYIPAIEEGSNMVRIGSAIFGKRN